MSPDKIPAAAGSAARFRHSEQIKPAVEASRPWKALSLRNTHSQSITLRHVQGTPNQAATELRNQSSCALTQASISRRVPFSAEQADYKLICFHHQTTAECGTAPEVARSPDSNGQNP